tara:strand:- start:603 stop:800 length:198 start_codon:yes stop_codon:yes gene_type:complete
MSETKLARLVTREASKRMEKEIRELGGLKSACREHICDDSEDLKELFMFNVGEEFVKELEELCNL